MYRFRGHDGRRGAGQRPLRVAFFLGSDATSHLIANRLIPIMLEQDMSVQLYLTRARPSARRPETLRQLFFVEHGLLQEHAYPFIDSLGVPQPGRCNTPTGWLALEPGRITAQLVPDVNDPAFVGSLARDTIDVAVSVRCYQKFKPPILDVLGGPESGSVFVNLHPGLLPSYRGVNTFLWSMRHGAREAGFTLHHLAVDWDTGPVIGQARFPLDYSHSVVENMLLHTADAAGLILDLVNRKAAGHPVPTQVQDESQARYFSYPADPDLAALADDGIDVFRAAAVVDLLVDAFFETVPDTAQFRETLINAADGAGVPCEYATAGRLIAGKEIR